MSPKITLRDYQHRDVNALRSAFRAGLRAVLYVLPTGGGKTFCFSYITQNAAAKGNRVLILVHRQELLLQSSESLSQLGVEHGLIAPGHSPTYDPVQVASVQTLVRRLDKVPNPDLIVIDEAHHANAASWAKVIEHFKTSRLLGVTATPCRLDGAGLGTHGGGYFETMVMGPTIAELIARGYLSPPRVYAPPSGLDLSGVRTKYGDYSKHEMAAAVDKPKITGSAVEHYRKICPGTPAIAFCASVAHAEHVATEFRAAGFAAASIDGTMHDGQRKGLIRSLAQGKIKILTSCDIVSEGTDIPVVGAAILLRPTQSLGLYLQQVGRALRPYEGKNHAVILDHVGNCHRHGLPDDLRDWTLEGKKKTAKGGKPEDQMDRVKQCERCYAVHAPAKVCPHCGHIYDDAPLPEHVDGQLKEVDEMEAERIRRALHQERSRAKTLEDLEVIGRQRGYKPGWAKYVWESRQKRQRGNSQGR